MASKPSLALKRRFKASPAQLFEAWTQPQKMIRWWGVTDHPSAPIAEADLKVGGGFRVRFHTPDGEHHSVSGVYREIEPDRKARLLVGLAEHARARIAGHDRPQAGR